jgi:NAD(P)-dependent dehydrogenase (short-subunit alcohol dehydrogenase family)
MSGVMMVAVFFSLVVLLFYPTKTSGHAIRRCGLVFMVLWQIKRDMDVGVTQSHQLVVRDLSRSTCLITGAENDLGRAVAVKLLSLNCNVIMACQSSKEVCLDAVDAVKKENAKIAATFSSRLVGSISQNPPFVKSETGTSGSVTYMPLNLGDLMSVQLFAKDFKSKYSHLDVIVNNAGWVPKVKGMLSAQGIEESIAVMHIGHCALEKWLMGLLTKQPPKSSMSGGGQVAGEASRIVYVGSQIALMGSFDSSLMQDAGEGDWKLEVTTSPYALYARARLANVLHIEELQRRMDIKATNTKAQRRLVTSYVTPGNYIVKDRGLLSNPLTDLFLRTPDEAAYVVLYAILSDGYLPSSYIDPMMRHHDVTNFRTTSQDDMLSIHGKAFPWSLEFPFNRLSPITTYKFEEDQFKRKTNFLKNRAADISDQRSVARRLWTVTDQTILEFEAASKRLGKKQWGMEDNLKLKLSIVRKKIKGFSLNIKSEEHWGKADEKLCAGDICI